MVRFGALLFAVASAVIATNAQAQYTPWTGSDLSIGKGYDRFLAQARGRCVTYDKKGPLPVAGEDIRFELRSVENEQSLFNKLGVSVSAKYGAVKGNASYDRETSVNNYSVYFFISGNIEVFKESISQPDLTDPKLTTDRHEQLDRKDISGFREKCGDTYVSGMSYGGRYIALVEIKTRKDSEVTAIAAAVSGAAGAFSGEATVQSRLEAAVQNKEVSIKILRGAGDGAVIPTSIGELTRAVTRFPDSLRGVEKRKLQPFDVTVEDYISIDTPEHIKRSDFSTIDQEEFITNADRFVVKHRTAMANADYAMKNPDQFPQIDKAVLQSYIDTAETIILRVVSDIKKCLTGVTVCKDFQVPTLLVVSPPPRIEGLSRAELETSINRSREAISATILEEGNGLANYCVGITDAFRRDEWSGCVKTMNDVRKKCNERGCKP